MRILKKALPVWSAFFVFWSVDVLALCSVDQKAENVEVAHVYDGDTVRLKDGRKIRIIGINTPETEKENQSAEFMADRATQELKQILNSTEVSLLLGEESQDRYKRWLGHLFVDGELVSEQMLHRGLAFHIAIPPNLNFAKCLKKAELQARGKGVWKAPSSLVKNVADLGKGESGFRVLTGDVTSFRQIRNGYILELEDILAVKVSVEQLQDLGFYNVNGLKGAKVRVRGWIKPKNSKAPSHYLPWFLVITHPFHFELL
jgi:endonuclease YncB( thermonuclease family)